MEIRSNYHNKLNAVFNDVIQMGDVVIEALHLGLESLVNADKKLAEQVIEGDKEVDRLELVLQDRCVLLLAKETPVATELREVVTVIKIISELERLGDHAKHLAQKAGKVNKKGLKLAAPIFEDMLEYAIQMVEEALRAFLEQDSKWAREIAKRDNFIDEKYADLYTQLVNLIKDKPNKAENLIPLIFLNRHLERVGDRVTNICEFVVYSTTNKHTDLN